MSERVIWPGIARVCRYFPQAEGEGKYCTRVQCLAILPSHECNDYMLSPSSVAWLTNSLPNKATPTNMKDDWIHSSNIAKRKLALLQTTKEKKASFNLESYLTE